MLYKIRKNKILIFLFYFIIFTLILHFSIKGIQDINKIVNYIMVSSGCRLEKITIYGNKMFTNKEINNILSPFMGENTFTLPLKKIQTLLLANPWCKSIIIIRKLPNEIIIKLEEHKAFALINDETIVNREFKPITSASSLSLEPIDNDKEREDSAPRPPILKPEKKEEKGLRLFNAGANHNLNNALNHNNNDNNDYDGYDDNDNSLIDNELTNIMRVKTADILKAKSFTEKLAPFSEIFKQVKTIEDVSSRRWNIILKNGLLIKLPEANVLQVLQEIKQLEDQKNILSLDFSLENIKIKMLDFRIPEKIFLIAKNS